MPVRIKNRIVNGVEPDETAQYEPSHQDLHCLQEVFQYAGWKGKGFLFYLVSEVHTIHAQLHLDFFFLLLFVWKFADVFEHGRKI